jgi:hypothetical protein
VVVSRAMLETFALGVVLTKRCPLRISEQARASLFFQATKSQRWMPWHQEPMKDVSDCEKLRGAVY